jgi:F-type H+-transporting ATPase subunit b
MTLDWWTLGLQAINVLILVWLLSRLFWRPVAEAIARRQDMTADMLKAAGAAQAKADGILAEVTATRADMASERDTLLAEAAIKAEAAAKVAMKEAAEKAEALLTTARLEAEQFAKANRAKTATDSAQLAVDIARKLLTRLEAGKIEAPFLDPLIKSIDAMPPADRAALVATTGGIDVISAVDPNDTTKARIKQALGAARDGKPHLHFRTDPELIAGFELHTAHVVLRSSWAADLDAILKDLTDAA